MKLNSNKDEKIQIYRVMERKEGTVVKRNRCFIYPHNVFYEGGIWANVRCLQDSEKVSNGITQEKHVLQFTVERNPKIDSAQKIIYLDQVYEIESIDGLDGRTLDIKFKAIRCRDTNQYGEDQFDESF